MAIRESGLDYTIIRAGMLQNSAGGQRPIEITQQALPLSIRYRIARADVAEVFVAAMENPRASRATFDMAWDRSKVSEPWPKLLDRLKPDAELAIAKFKKCVNVKEYNHGHDFLA